MTNVIDMKTRKDLVWLKARDIIETSTDWLWWPYIAAENINIIAGMGNEGKGLVCIDIAARVTRGRALPMCSEKAPQGDVLWLEMEDDLGSTIKPRLEAARADIDRVHILDPDSILNLSPSQHIDAIGQHIRALKPRLVVMSPMNSFLGSLNLNNELEVRAAFEKLRNYTLGLGTAIIGIAHANKKTELSSIERVSGSVAYVNFCRSVILAVGEDVDKGTRRFVHGKWNMSRKGPDLLYEPYYDGEDPKERDQHVRLRWDTPLSDVDHKKAFNQADDDKKPEGAGDWLLQVLEAGPVLVSKLKDDAAKAKKRWGSVEQARQRLNAKNGDFYIEASGGTWTLARRT